MLLDRKIYKGIEYIHLNDLPQAQREKLHETLDHSLFIKIMIDGEIVSNCIQYRDYSYWYSSVYRPAKTVKVETESAVEFKPELVLNG